MKNYVYLSVKYAHIVYKKMSTQAVQYVCIVGKGFLHTMRRLFSDWLKPKKNEVIIAKNNKHK